jgi:predicted Zn-dependent protease with MMP-like domain
MVTRAERFDDLVLDSAQRLESVIGTQAVEFAVEDVPPSDPAPWEGEAVPLGRVFPGQGSHSPRIVVYRRPVEARAADERELAQVVHDVVVEQVAALLGVRPGEVDRRYDDGED